MPVPPPITGYADSEDGAGVWKFPAGTLLAIKTLSITAAFTRVGVGSYASGTIDYSLNGGTTWTNLITTAASVASATYTATLAIGQNTANVWVRIAASASPATSTHRGNSARWNVGTMKIA